MKTAPQFGDAPSRADCCSGFYEQDWVRTVAGDNSHPGGEALSRKLVASMGLGHGAQLVDFEDESGGFLELISRLKRTLLLWAAGQVSGTLPPGLPLTEIRYWLDRIKAEVEAGVVRYYRFELVS